MLPAPFTISPLTYTATLALTQPITAISILSFLNPLPSQTAFKITLKFYNASSPSVLVDSCSASLTFQALTLQSSSVSYGWTPGNVTTSSNLSVSLRAGVWVEGKMGLKVSILRYWKLSLQNVSSSTVISGMSYCQPSC